MTEVPERSAGLGPALVPAAGTATGVRGTAEGGASPERALWDALQGCLHLAHGTLGTVLREQSGLSRPRFEALAQLHRAAEGLSMGELARGLRVSNASATALVDALAADGWAERVPSPHDRRKVTARLTAPARQAFAALQGPYDQAVAALFGGLSQPERALLLGLLDKLRGHLQQQHEARAADGAGRPPGRKPVHGAGPGWGWV